jgi:hypothetical protein
LKPDLPRPLPRALRVDLVELDEPRLIDVFFHDGALREQMAHLDVEPPLRFEIGGAERAGCVGPGWGIGEPWDGALGRWIIGRRGELAFRFAPGRVPERLLLEVTPHWEAWFPDQHIRVFSGETQVFSGGPLRRDEFEVLAIALPAESIVPGAVHWIRIEAEHSAATLGRALPGRAEDVSVGVRFVGFE